MVFVGFNAFNDWIISLFLGLKVGLLGLLVNMYIFKLSKPYNKRVFQTWCFITNLFLKALVKIMQKGIPVAQERRLKKGSATRVLFYEIMENNGDVE